MTPDDCPKCRNRGWLERNGRYVTCTCTPCTMGCVDGVLRLQRTRTSFARTVRCPRCDRLQAQVKAYLRQCGEMEVTEL